VLAILHPPFGVVTSICGLVCRYSQHKVEINFINVIYLNKTIKGASKMKALQIKKQLSENERQQMRIEQMREQSKNEFKELYNQQLNEQKKQSLNNVKEV
jgi:hypothetical protein